MAEERAKRKLSAILSADVKGYSRLMGEDELATIETLKKYRVIMATLINKFQGRVVDSPGDNVLAEFSSVVDALECSVEIQKELKQKNEQLPENRRMEFRIGVNLGDVVEDGERIYGDGVNIAARVESLAEGGGICISGTAFDQIGKKLPLGYEYLGEQTVKNIEKPVRAFRVLMEPEYAGKVIGEERPRPTKWPRTAIAAFILLVIVAGALAIWNFYLRPPSIEPASMERMAYPLPEEPSIAVLPFTNMSDDPKQEYFSDGITEEVITALAKIPQLFVIARNSTFTYKGKPVKVQKVAEDLGVRYVLEGGVRKAGDKIRITAQLIDAINGRHLWAERYGGALGDVFALQDKITRKIVAALAVKLTAGEQEKIARGGTDNIEAYDAYLQGEVHFRRFKRDDWAKAATYYKKAVELDPNYSRAHARLAGVYWWSTLRVWHKHLGWPDAVSLAKKHLKMAMKNPTAQLYHVATSMHLFEFRYEEAIADAERMIALDPGRNSYYNMGRILVFSGRSKEAAEFFKRAIRLDPYHPNGLDLFYLGFTQFLMGNLEEAATFGERARRRNSTLPPWPLVATYGYLGREQEAADIIAEYIKMKGWKHRVTVKWLLKYFPFKDPKDTDRYAEGLHKAGVPME
jgi:adenylate cyclase